MVVFDNAGKRYRSLFGHEVRALHEVSLTVDRGEVLGLAGPNGAGKSTLVNLLLGFLRPTSGQVTIDGLAPREYVERFGVGYVSELIAVPPRWTAREALARYAVLAGLPAAQLDQRVATSLDVMGLGEHASKPVRALSKGTLQRLGLAQALLRDEQLLVLDEPTYGLDPVWTSRFRGMVATLRRADRAILIASHNLDELDRLTDRVAILDDGRLRRVVRTGWSAAEVAGAVTYHIVFASGIEHVGAVFPDATPLRRGEVEVRAASLTELNAGLAALLARGALVAGVAPALSTLEQQFRDVVGAEE